MANENRREANFTKKTIDAEQAPASGRAYLYDTKEGGLVLQTMPSGRKTFQLYKWHQGGAVRITLGTWPETTVEQARRAAREAKVKLANGENPNDTLKQARQEMTFGELFAEFIERHAKVRKRTWKADEEAYHRHLAKPLGHKKLSAITRRDIANLHSRIGKEHPTNANRLLALISSVFGRAISFGYWENANPCLGVKPFPEAPRDRFLSGEELRKLFEALDAELNPIARDFFMVALFTGARRANVLEMRWEDIDLDAGAWRIPRTKNGTPQVVNLVPTVVDLLRQRQEAARKAKTICSFVFPGQGRTGHFAEPKSAWRRICKAAGIDGAHIHDLRRTMGSWQAITGASLPIIGKSLNHKKQSTTAIYARLSNDPVRAAMEKAEAAMLANRDKLPTLLPIRKAAGE